MSSINEKYTFHYRQPSEYRLSHDSVFLSQLVFSRLSKKGTSPLSILDLCAGSGVCGLDFLFHWLKAGLTPPKNLDFIEVQPVFESYLKENIEEFKRLFTNEIVFNVFIKNFASRDVRANLKCNPSGGASLIPPMTKVQSNAGAQNEEQEIVQYHRQNLMDPEFLKYDLIICNPPYFRAGMGKLSPSDLKNRSRFFLDSTFENFIAYFDSALSPGGEAYVLLRDLSAHGIDVQSEAIEILAKQGIDLKISRIERIRSTDVYLLSKELN